MGKVISAVVLSSLLSGCLTAADRMAADDSKCRSYGAVPGSQAYVACRTQLDTTRTAAAAAILASPSGMHCTTMAHQTTCNAY